MSQAETKTQGQIAAKKRLLRTQPSTKPVPGPHLHPFLGMAKELQHDPLGFLRLIAEHYGDVVRVRLPFQPGYAIFHPDGVRHVFQENHRNYDRDVPGMKELKPFLGNGLAINYGSSWLRQRRLMQPAFHASRITTYVQMMVQYTEQMLASWTEGEMVDIHQELIALTLRIVAQALFSIDMRNQAEGIGKAFLTVMNLLGEYVYLPFPPLHVPTPRNRRIQEALRTLNAAVQDIITAHRADDGDTGDVLSMLLSARDEETGGGMSDEQVRDEVMTLLFAGHETTANLITWSLYLLSLHPGVEQRFLTEVADVLGGQSPTASAALSYTGRIIDETLRLYPSTAMLARHAIADDEIGGYPIPRDSLIWVSASVTHRHPDFWENPETFDPERFTPARSAGRHRYAYFPFGGGPHLCIGNTFALMEAKLILSTIAQRYRLSLVPDHPVEPFVSMTIKPRYGMMMIPQRI